MTERTLLYCDGCTTPLSENRFRAAIKYGFEKKIDYDLCDTCAALFRRAIDPQYWPEFLKKHDGDPVILHPRAITS